ncbi:hypothetical protein HAX54_051462 [Datura stramonium]|uniref:Uncharacterized protein n=1 Tax=Datura stramonium TaxID=4076 RepID=A0ABS8SYA2_DATST|nr:hypothetical protein [Datura stramonium]
MVEFGVSVYSSFYQCQQCYSSSSTGGGMHFGWGASRYGGAGGGVKKRKTDLEDKDKKCSKDSGADPSRTTSLFERMEVKKVAMRVLQEGFPRPTLVGALSSTTVSKKDTPQYSFLSGFDDEDFGDGSDEDFGDGRATVRLPLLVPL